MTVSAKREAQLVIKAQHTPGPWSFDHDWHRLPTIFAADGKTKVATIEKKSREFHTAEQEADARLIEAAPDLLAALKDIAALCIINHDRLGNVQRVESIAARARAGLSKAEHSEPGSPAQSVNARGGHCPPPVFRRGE